MDDNNPFQNVVWWFKTRDTGELAFIGVLALLGVILLYMLVTSGGSSESENPLAGDITTGQVTPSPTVALAATPTTIVIPTPMATATPKPSAKDLVSGTDNADKVSDDTEKADAKPTPTKKPKPAANSGSTAGASTGSNAGRAPASGGGSSGGSGGSTAPSGGTGGSGGGAATGGNSSGGGSGAGATGQSTGGGNGGAGATGGTGGNGGNGDANAGGGAEAGATNTPEPVQNDSSFTPPDSNLSHETCDGAITFGGLCDENTQYEDALNGTSGGNAGGSNPNATPDPDAQTTPSATSAPTQPTQSPAATTEPDNPSAFGASAQSSCQNGYRTVTLNMTNGGEEATTFLVSYEIPTGAFGSDAFTVEPGFTSQTITGLTIAATEIEVSVDGVSVLTQSFSACE